MYVCVRSGVNSHALMWMCGAKTITWESVHCHACHAVEAKRQDSYTVSADRQTDLGIAVYDYMCEYSICSTVTYMSEYLRLCAFMKEV